MPDNRDSEFDRCFKYYEKAIEGRNFHYQNYNTWVNYYSIFTGALFICYYYIIAQPNGFFHKIFVLLISFLGLLTSICWNLTVKGHYNWMLSWIKIVQDYEKELKTVSTTNPKYYVYNVYKNINSSFYEKNISSQKLTSTFTFIISLSWGLIVFYHSYKFLVFIMDRVSIPINVIILSIAFLMVVLVFLFLYIILSSGSDISTMKSEIKE